MPLCQRIPLFQASGMLQTQFPGCTLHSCLVIKPSPYKSVPGAPHGPQSPGNHWSFQWKLWKLHGAGAGGAAPFAHSQLLVVLRGHPVSGGGAALSLQGSAEGTQTTPGNVTFHPSPPPSPGELHSKGENRVTPKIPTVIAGNAVQFKGSICLLFRI